MWPPNGALLKALPPEASKVTIEVGGGGGDAGPAIDAWNKLLGNYGF
jgi:hypothetical protein